MTETTDDIFVHSMLEKKIYIPITEVNKYIDKTIKMKIQNMVEGKCIAEGYIRAASVSIVKYSSPVINNENVEFIVVFECDICHPMEGMQLRAKVLTVTNAGVHGYVTDEKTGQKPITVFVTRDHHYGRREFQEIKEGEEITVEVVGARYELNDDCIYVIAEMV